VVRSSLSYAIMALLASKPQTGYDLARQMRSPFGYLWQANHSQIYPELARLVKARLVHYKRSAPASGPARKIHSLTPAGRSELRIWLAQNPLDRPANDELVIKAYALRGAQRAAWVTMLKGQIVNHEARLAALEHLSAGIQARAQATIEPESARFGEYAALRLAIGSEREYLAWCSWLLAELSPRRAERRPAGQSRSPRTSRARR